MKSVSLDEPRDENAGQMLALTYVAGVSDPLDTDVLANLKVGLVIIHGNNVAGTFVSTDEAVEGKGTARVRSDKKHVMRGRKHGRYRYSRKLVRYGPVTKHCVQVGVADTGVCFTRRFSKARSFHEEDEAAATCCRALNRGKLYSHITRTRASPGFNSEG